MAFVFSLASVLAHRRRREEEEERLLGRVAAELEEAQQTSDRLSAELRRLAAERSGEAPRRIQATDLHERYARVSLVEQARSEILVHIAELNARREAQRQAYLLARRDRELLEELHATQRARFLGELARQEAKRNDDTFLSRYCRR